MPSTSLPAADPRQKRLARLTRIAERLDGRFRLPGTGIRFGWDSILGLVPGVGDLVTTGPSLWMIYEGWQMGARKRVLAKMGANAMVDLTIGGLPLIGDAFDLYFKSHRRNVALLKRDLANPKYAIREASYA